MNTRLANTSHASLSRAAYTLTEVCIATALLAILGVSLYGGMSSGFALTQASRENLRATQILVERMEGIRLFNWYQLNYSNNWVPEHFTDYYYPLTNAGETPGIVYRGTMRVINNPALNPSVSYGPNLSVVEVTVDWESGGVPRSRTLATYVAKSGVQNYVFASTNYLYYTP